MKCSIENRILTSLNIKTIDQSIQAATDGWLSFDSSPRQLIRGGSVAHNLGQGKLMDRANGLMRMPSKVRAQRSVAPVEFTVSRVKQLCYLWSKFAGRRLMLFPFFFLFFLFFLHFVFSARNL